MLRLWLASQKRCGSSQADDTEARLQELCAAEGWSPDGSDGEEDEEGMDNSEPLEDSDVVLSDSGKRCEPSNGEPAFCPPDISRRMDSNIEFTLCSSYDFSICFLDDDLEGYDKMVSGRRKAGRVSHLSVCHLISVFHVFSVLPSALFASIFLLQWNKRNEKGETSLHRACIDGNLKQVQYLVEQVSKARCDLCLKKILHYFIVNVQNQDKKNTMKVRQMRVQSSGNCKISKCTWQKSNCY